MEQTGTEDGKSKANEMDLDESVEDELVFDKEDDEQNDGAKDEVNPNGPDDKLYTNLPQFLRKEKTLKELLGMMDEYAPIIPDAVTDYYLARAGFECDDVRIKRLLALATQKFISDVATDAYEYSRIRSSSSIYNSSNPQARARALMAGQTTGAAASTNPNNQGKTVLTVEDLSSALAEYGLNVRRPDFYR